MYGLIASALLASLLSPQKPATQRVPFSGWFKAELVSDSIWGHCELAAFVDEHSQGTQRVTCRSEDGKPTVQVEERLSSSDIAQLRQLLRDADLFQGQFWGSDLRGLDAVFTTLAVNDESRAAVVVCYKNEAFETGSRRRLLDWTERMRAKERQGRSN